jgi:outer membrane lipoprotein LolB
MPDQPALASASAARRRLVCMLPAASAWAALGACASPPNGSLPAAPSAPADAAPAHSYSGRLLLKVSASASGPARSISAGFSLLGSPEAGELLLVSALGQSLLQARWQPGSATLWTATGGEPKRFENLRSLLDEALTDVLDAPLPLVALFDWLRGQPWSGAPSQAMPELGFEQLGWQVRTKDIALGRLQASRSAPPAIELRVVLDGRSAAS